MNLSPVLTGNGSSCNVELKGDCFLDLDNLLQHPCKHQHSDLALKLAAPAAHAQFGARFGQRAVAPMGGTPPAGGAVGFKSGAGGGNRRRRGR